MSFTEAQLQKILDSRAQEGAYLDFKRGEALGKSGSLRKELVKDCTGFANADGGLLLYGIAEEKLDGVNVAASLHPVADTSMNADWISDVVCGNTSPPLREFEITELPVTGGKIIAIEIQASSTAHQNLFDHRYYQRVGRSTSPMADFQIRDVMSRRTRPEARVDLRLVNIECNADRHRKALEVIITNVGQVTLEHWQFEIDLPYEVLLDSEYPDPVKHMDIMVSTWRDRMSFAYTADNQRLLRVTFGDPDEDQNRRILHPRQTRVVVDPDQHPAVVLDIDHDAWQKVHGKSIFWRVFMPNAQPITGEWRFDDWCRF